MFALEVPPAGGGRNSWLAAEKLGGKAGGCPGDTETGCDRLSAEQLPSRQVFLFLPSPAPGHWSEHPREVQLHGGCRDPAPGYQWQRPQVHLPLLRRQDPRERPRGLQRVGCHSGLGAAPGTGGGVVSPTEGGPCEVRQTWAPVWFDKPTFIGCVLGQATCLLWASVFLQYNGYNSTSQDDNEDT